MRWICNTQWDNSWHTEMFVERLRNSALGRYWRRGGSAIEHHAMKTRGEVEKPLHTFYTLVLDRQA